MVEVLVGYDYDVDIDHVRPQHVGVVREWEPRTQERPAQRQPGIGEETHTGCVDAQPGMAQGGDDRARHASRLAGVRPAVILQQYEISYVWRMRTERPGWLGWHSMPS